MSTENQTDLPTGDASENYDPSTEGHVPFLEILFLSTSAASPSSSGINVPSFNISVKEHGEVGLPWSPFQELVMNPMGDVAPEEDRTQAGDFASQLLGRMINPLQGPPSKHTQGTEPPVETWEHRVRSRTNQLRRDMFPDIPDPEIAFTDKTQIGSSFIITTYRPMTLREQQETAWNSYFLHSQALPAGDQGTERDSDNGIRTQVGSVNDDHPQEATSSPVDISEGQAVEEDPPGHGDSMIIDFRHDSVDGRFSYTVTDAGRPVPLPSGGTGTRAHDFASDLISTLNSRSASSRSVIGDVFTECLGGWQDGRYIVSGPVWVANRLGSDSAQSDLSFGVIVNQGLQVAPVYGVL